MKVTELFSTELYEKMLEEGYVKEQSHPDFPSKLRIRNYTEKAQYDQVWNPVTTLCRGLVLDEFDNVIARPLPKFFNYDHKETPTLDVNAPAIVMDKADGSLGIVYPLPYEGWAVATRGSFASEQAIHATQLLNTKYGEWLAGANARLEQYTMLVEIVYPENRIVLDYGDMDDLILLGMIDTRTGAAYPAGEAKEFFDWPGPVVEEFEYKTFGEAMQAEPRENAEGFVVFFPDKNMFVKIKQEDYLLLHRIVTGLNARAVWKAMQEKDLDEFIEDIPDEFHEWVKDVWAELETRYKELEETVFEQYRYVCAQTVKYRDNNPEMGPRKAFARFAKEGPFTGWMFSILDGKDISKKLWEVVKPEGGKTVVGKEFSEDY